MGLYYWPFLFWKLTISFITLKVISYQDHASVLGKKKRKISPASKLKVLRSIANKHVSKVKNDHRRKFSNLSNWKEEAWKNQGFNGIWTCDLRDTGAMLYQLRYEATYWERGQFIEFISPMRSEMMWSIYEIINIKHMSIVIICWKT